MKRIKYHMYIGSLSACMKKIMEATKGLGQRDVESTIMDCLIFDSWFVSNRLAGSAIDIGADMAGMVEINT